MQQGLVKWFNEKKGIGFIVPDDGGVDHFVYYKNIIAEGFKTLIEGDRVEFKASSGEKGMVATDVRVVGNA